MKTQKTKKSFKKKALLSSLSMLMVATVAVGSATYAWFMQNPQATASGLALKATASKGLVILTESHKAAITDEIDPAVHFKSTDYLNYDSNTGISKTTAFALTPASFDVTAGAPAGAGYTTTAASNSASTASGEATVDSATKGYNGTQAIYKEDIFCALSGATSTDDTTPVGLNKLTVTFNGNASALKNSLRFVVSYTAKNGSEKILGAYALEDEETNNDQSNTALVGIIAANTKYKNLAAENKGTATFAKLTQDTGNQNKYYVTPASGNSNLGTLGQSGDDKVTVYVYLDGEDEDCYSQRINANNLISSVDVSLAIPTT